MNAESLARLFHSLYEQKAPEFGYVTRPDTREFNSESPQGKLAIAVCEEVLRHLAQESETLGLYGPPCEHDWVPITAVGGAEVQLCLLCGFTQEKT